MKFQYIFSILLFVSFSDVMRASGIEGKGLGITKNTSKLTTEDYYKSEYNKTGFDESSNDGEYKSKIEDVTDKDGNEDEKEFKKQNQELPKKTLFNKLKSSIDRTDICKLPALIYYPIVSAIYAIPYACYKTVQHFEDKKNGKSKPNVTFFTIEDKFSKLNGKINTFLESAGIKLKTAYEAAKTKLGKKQKNPNETPTIQNEPEFITHQEFGKNFRLWTRAILTGITMWYAVKLTDKLLRHEKLGTIGKNYTNWQNKYDMWRILVVNKTWHKMVNFFDTYVIPTNATITYQYQKTANP